MKKLISLLSILFVLTLIVPPKQAEAYRGPGGSPGSGGHGDYSGPGGNGGYSRPEGPEGRGGHGGYSGRGGHGGFRESDRYHGHGGYGWYGDFFPGLIIGSILGWALWPDYYYPPYYYYPTPPEANQAPPPASQGSDFRMFIYPRQGQSEEQQKLDFDECHSWAVSQIGYDPTQPTSSVPEAQTNQKRADYQRAMGACLDARGYTAK